MGSVSYSGKSSTTKSSKPSFESTRRVSKEYEHNHISDVLRMFQDVEEKRIHLNNAEINLKAAEKEFKESKQRLFKGIEKLEPATKQMLTDMLNGKDLMFDESER